MKRPWGYSQEGMVNVRLNNNESYAALSNELSTLPEIQKIAGTIHNVGVNSQQLKAVADGQEHNVRGLSVGNTYVETMDLSIVEGQSFKNYNNNSNQKGILINEEFRKRLNWEKPVGKQIQIDSTNYQVIGLVADFRQNSFDIALSPVVMRLAPDSLLSLIVMRTDPAQLGATTKLVESTWKHTYPETPFDHYFQDAVFDNYFIAFTQIGNVLSATAFLTIVISIIGLFGLAMLILTRKMKELSIRKVLGANIFQLGYQINKDFILTIAIAVIIGMPLGYLMLKSILDLLYPEAAMQFSSFLLAILSLLVMTLLSVAKHIYSVAVSNPSDFLRDE